MVIHSGSFGMRWAEFLTVSHKVPYYYFWLVLQKALVVVVCIPASACGLLRWHWRSPRPSLDAPEEASAAGLGADAAFSSCHSWWLALCKPPAAGEAVLSANSNYCSPELLGERSCAG